jgi:hypothetical protein
MVFCQLSPYLSGILESGVIVENLQKKRHKIIWYKNAMNGQVMSTFDDDELQECF